MQGLCQQLLAFHVLGSWYTMHALACVSGLYCPQSKSNPLFAIAAIFGKKLLLFVVPLNRASCFIIFDQSLFSSTLVCNLNQIPLSC